MGFLDQLSRQVCRVISIWMKRSRIGVQVSDVFPRKRLHRTLNAEGLDLSVFGPRWLHCGVNSPDDADAADSDHDDSYSNVPKLLNRDGCINILRLVRDKKRLADDGSQLLWIDAIRSRVGSSSRLFRPRKKKLYSSQE